MTWPTLTKNAMLNGQAITQASLHTAFPGTTGANEVSGGTPAYARKTIAFNPASGGVRSLAGAVTFDVPAVTIRWLGFWNAGAFVACCPNGGSIPKNFMASPATDLIHSTGHGWIDGQKIVFHSGIPPGGLTEGTVYEVTQAAADSFKVSVLGAGVAINITSAASFGCVVSAITEDVYAVQGTHDLATASFVFSD